MAKLILTSNAASKSAGGFVQISFSLLGGGSAPFETRTVEIRTADEATAAFRAYLEDATATGTGVYCSGRLKDGDRAPRGFRALKLEGYANLKDA